MKADKFIINEKESVQKLIIADIKQVINDKNLEPGDKLPSERFLADKFEVPRNIVREAIQKLEFYGLVNSKPQSGTFVANIGVTAMNGMIDDIMDLEAPDFRSLVETRILLELKTVRLAALRRTDDDLIKIKKAMIDYRDKVINGENAVQEDLLFHLAIAQASGNTTLRTFMLIITPGIITNFDKHHVCDSHQSMESIRQHEEIFETIENRDTENAKLKMKAHFSELYKYCYSTTTS